MELLWLYKCMCNMYVWMETGENVWYVLKDVASVPCARGGGE